MIIKKEQDKSTNQGEGFY